MCAEEFAKLEINKTFMGYQWLQWVFEKLLGISVHKRIQLQSH